MDHWRYQHKRIEQIQANNDDIIFCFSCNSISDTDGRCLTSVMDHLSLFLHFHSICVSGLDPDRVILGYMMSCILWFDLSLPMPWQLVNSLPNLVGDDWLSLFQVTEQFIFLSDGLKWLTPYITRRPTQWPHVSYHCIGHWPTPWPYDCMTWPHDQLQRQSPRKNHMTDPNTTRQ